MSLLAAFLITLSLSFVWLRTIDFFAVKGFISKKLSRKIIHIGTGPIFVLCWIFFPENDFSRYVAAIVPLLITIQFFFIGIGLIKDQASVDAMSRSGDPKEILKGPFFYGVAFVVITILFWKESPIGIIALMILSGGDGFADVVGRRVPSLPLKWSPGKSLAGTIAMFLGGTIFSIVVLLIFNISGIMTYNFSRIIPRIFVLNIIATIIESLPIKDWDNITVPVVVILVGLFIF